MVYMGSKNRIAKDILQIMLQDKKDNQYFVDLFCGGCNIVDKVSGLRIANDTNKFLIDMFIALQNGWVPPEYINKEQYEDIKNNKDNYDSYLVGYVGFVCSYLGKFFNGYVRQYETRNIQKEYRNNLLRHNFKGILFVNKSFEQVDIPENSIVYCDPPYEGRSKNTKYDTNIDYTFFWEYVRRLSQHNKVYISGYDSTNVPSDFVSVYKKKRVTSLSLRDNNVTVDCENLFVIK